MTDNPVPGPSTEITLAMIRERAYELWERHHRPDGFEIELWLQAERELRAERDGRERAATRQWPRENPDEAT